MHKPTLHTRSSQPICFTPYGHSGAVGVSAIVTGFNGTPFDTHANCYHLGQGHRAYLPGIMKFSSADSLSPFGLGGLNAYAYCNGDPVNYSDPQGTNGVLSAAQKLIGRPPIAPSSGRITGRGQFDIGKTLHEVKSRRNQLRQDRMVLQKQAEGVNLALDLLDHEPDLFNTVIKHLQYGDLHNAASNHPGTQNRLREAGTRAYAVHLEGILNGQIRQYDDDFLLTIGQKVSLSILENDLVNAYAPFAKANNHKYFGGYDWSMGPLNAQRSIRNAKKHLNSGL